MSAPDFISDEEMAALDAPDFLTDEQFERVESGRSELRTSLPAQAPADVPSGRARTTALSAANTVAGGLEMGALMRMLTASGQDDYAAAQANPLGLAGGEDTSTFNPLESYRVNRDALAGGLARDQAANPDEARLGTGLGIAAQVVPAAPQLIRSIPGLLQGLRAAPSAPLATAKGLVSGAYAGAKPGAVFGAAQGALGSEGDLTRGDVGQVAQDLVSGALQGAGLGAALGAPFGAAQGAVAGRAAGAKAKAIDATDLEEVAAARDSLPARTEAVKARNAASTEGAKAENVKARRAYDEAVEKEALATRIENERRVAQAAEERTVRGQLAQQENARRLAAAESESRRGSPERAIRMTGLDKVKMDPVERQRVAKALYDEQGPGGGSLAEELYAKDPREGYAAARKLREGTGAELGRIRREVAERGGQREYKVVVERLAEEFGTPKTDVERQAYKAVLAAVKKVGKKSGVVKADDLADLSDEAGELGYAATAGSAAQGRSKALERAVYKRARSVFAGEYKALVSELTPTNVPAFETANAKYGNYKQLERGTKALADSFDASLERRRLAKLVRPEKVKPEPVRVARVRPSPVDAPEPVQPALEELPAEPQFPGGPDAELAAEARLAPRGTRAKMLGATVAGGLAGAKAGRPILGAQLAREVARAYLAKARPSAQVFRGNADAARAALEKHAPLLQQALAAGPAAVRAMQAFLLENDPEYAAAYGGGSE